MAAAASPLRTAWHWGAAVVLRLALVAAGAGDALLWRPEVTTPANSLLSAREGLRLLQLGLQPYAGAACATPPLWMALLAPLARRRVLWVLPNVAADLVGAAALMAAASALFAPRQRGTQQQQHARGAALRAGSICCTADSMPSWQVAHPCAASQTRRGCSRASSRCCTCSIRLQSHPAWLGRARQRRTRP